MTMQILTTKLKKRAWIIILGTVIIGALGFVQAGKNVSYITSDNLSITLKNYQSLATDSELKQAGSDTSYIGAVNFAGLFLSSQLKSLPIQTQVAQKSDIKITSAIEKKALYSVEDITGGFVNVTNKFDSKEKAILFQTGLKSVAKSQVEINYNFNRNNKFAGEVNLSDNYIVEIKSPVETQALPSVAGFVLLLAICSITPLKKA